MRTVCIFVVFLFVLGPAAAADLSGVVRDADTAAPLAGAAVGLVDAMSGATLFSTVTRPDGTFTLTGIPEGSYRLTTTRLGYLDHCAELVVSTVSSSGPIEILLSASATTRDEVTVTATRAQAQVNPVTISNLTHQDLAERGAMKDLPVLLSELPATTYYSENGNGIGYSTLSMRGFDQRRLAVLVNGIPQNDPEDHNVFWINFFDLQGAISDIQVQRGAGASFYGSAAIGGAINIVALPYKPYRYASVEIGAGTFGTQRYTIEANSGLVGGRWILFGRFSRLLSDGYRDWSWTRFHRYFAGAVWYGKNATVTMQSYGGPQRDGLAFSGISKSANTSDALRRFNFSGFTRDTESFHQPHAELLHDWRFAPNWTLNQALFWVQGRGYFDFGGTFRSADYLRLPQNFRGLSTGERQLPLFLSAPDVALNFRAFLDQWQIGWLPQVTRVHAGGETTFGGEVRLHRSLRWGRIQEATGIPAELVGSERDARTYQFRGEKVSAAAFGHHLFRPVERLALQGDVQVSYQHYRNFDERFFDRRFRVPYVFVNPRIGVTLDPGKPWSAYASLAVAHREPRLKQIYDGEEAGAGFQPQFERSTGGVFDFGNPLVRPERLINLEVGTALRRSGYRLGGNFFLMRFSDEIVPSGGLDQFGVPRTGNADRTRHLGVELEAAARVQGGLDLSANLTRSHNRFLRFTEQVAGPDGRVQALDRRGNPIAGFPEWILNARLAQRWRGLVGAIDAKVVGRQFIDNSAGRSVDGNRSADLEVDRYGLLNVSALYDLPENSPLRGLRLSFNINNLLDSRVLLYGNVGPVGPQFFPAATRHMFASVRYTWH